jgi:integrase
VLPSYVREILSFVNWCASDPVTRARQWHWNAEPPQVRHAVRQYLTVAAKCRITVRPDTLGLKASFINATAGTRINVGLLLVALKKLYDVLADHGLYGWANPMVHEAARQTMGEVRRQRREAMRAATGRAPMPAISGVDAPPTDFRLSENYFRLVRTQWQPQSIDDPDFPRAVYAAGQAYGWSLREMCITRTLFESGARVSEVVGLTAGDWAVSQFLNRFHACNKGSHGRRVKTLVVSQLDAGRACGRAGRRSASRAALVCDQRTPARRARRARRGGPGAAETGADSVHGVAQRRADAAGVRTPRAQRQLSASAPRHASDHAAPRTPSRGPPRGLLRGRFAGEGGSPVRMSGDLAYLLGEDHDDS